MEKEAIDYSIEELNTIIETQEEVTIQYIYNLENRDKDYIGLKGIITGFRAGSNSPNLPSSIYFDPNEQSAFNAETGGIDLPNDISILKVRHIITH